MVLTSRRRRRTATSSSLMASLRCWRSSWTNSSASARSSRRPKPTRSTRTTCSCRTSPRRSRRQHRTQMRRLRPRPRSLRPRPAPRAAWRTPLPQRPLMKSTSQTSWPRARRRPPTSRRGSSCGRKSLPRSGRPLRSLAARRCQATRRSTCRPWHSVAPHWLRSARSRPKRAAHGCGLPSTSVTARVSSTAVCSRLLRLVWRMTPSAR
mmetsp:Transcript_96739/g.224262  ORF Transcript_96739/g.224262 Transcript_96739/m.224262 type:complete len:208 (-) Transcript_96739:747-1370(-)